MKKLLCWLTLLCLLVSALPTALAEGEAHDITERIIDLYYYYSNAVGQLPVYFIDGSDVPYLALSIWPDIVAGPPEEDFEDGEVEGDYEEPEGVNYEEPEGVNYEEPEDIEYEAPESVRFEASEAVDADPTGEGYTLTYTKEGSAGALTREDFFYVTFDCDADVIHFWDYDAFMRPASSQFLIDMLGANDADSDEIRYFRREKSSYERNGNEVIINAGDYGIDFIAQGTECYVPMQTLSDILLSYYNLNIYYNGEVAIIANSESFGDRDALTPMGEFYYSVQPRERSEAMAQFTYNELCLVMDTLYGLKESHDIQRFDDLADETGLKESLTDTDPVEADAALFILLEQHLDDQHTSFLLPSPMSGYEYAKRFADELGYGQSALRFWQQADPYADARKAAYPDGVPAYEEIGNTAFITLDGFDPIPPDVDYYQTPPTAEAKDTIGIMIYAYSRITREDSPVENIVLDLSCNLGGSAKAAVFTIAAFLGTASVSSKNTLSGALVTGNYRIDIDLDGKIDENDLALTGKNLFCLESPVSFSCGNLVPSAFKASNVVTLLGRTSGGGSCIVQPLSTASGTNFQISGSNRLAFLKNGAFYDIDQGAEPDLPLMKPASFYNRPALVDYINEVR